MSQVVHGRLSLALIMLRREPGSLVRRSDRLEAALTVGLVMLGIALVPVAVWLGVRTDENQSALARQQAHDLRQVTATTLEDATGWRAGADLETASLGTVPATWDWRESTHRGDLTVSAGTPAGSPVEIWVDRSGARAPEPVTEAGAAVSAVTVAAFSWVMVMLLAGAGVAIGNGMLNRRRDLQWTRQLERFLGDAPAH